MYQSQRDHYRKAMGEVVSNSSGRKIVRRKWEFSFACLFVCLGVQGGIPSSAQILLLGLHSGSLLADSGDHICCWGLNLGYYVQGKLYSLYLVFNDQSMYRGWSYFPSLSKIEPNVFVQKTRFFLFFIIMTLLICKDFAFISDYLGYKSHLLMDKVF